MQPALPPLVRQWLPETSKLSPLRSSTNGLLVGGTLAVMLRSRSCFALADNSGGGVGDRGMPLIMIALLTRFVSQPARTDAKSSRRRHLIAGGPLERSADLADQRRRRRRRQRVLLQQCVAARLSHGAGRADLISHMTALNLGQLPASFVLLGIPGRAENWVVVIAWRRPDLACIVGMITTAST